MDTLNHAKVLEDSGFSREQSESIIQLVGVVMTNDYVTKLDFRETLNKDLELHRQLIRQEMKELFDAFEKRMDEKFSHLESKMVIKVGVAQITTVGAIYAFAKLVKLIEPYL